MVSNLITQGQLLAAPLAGRINDVQRWMDSLLVRAEGVPPDTQPKSGGFPAWAVILIVVVLVLCLLPVCIIAILTLLGPAIGNVFSNIVTGV